MKNCQVYKSYNEGLQKKVVTRQVRLADMQVMGAL